MTPTDDLYYHDLEPSYYTLAEAARILNVHPKTLRKAIRSGIIPAVRVGPKAVRIPADALRPLTDQEENT